MHLSKLNSIVSPMLQAVWGLLVHDSYVVSPSVPQNLYIFSGHYTNTNLVFEYNVVLMHSSVVINGVLLYKQ